MAKLYPCANFEWDGRSVFDAGGGHWTACESCAVFIDIGKWEQLVTRVMQAVSKRKGLEQLDRFALRADLLRLYAAFRVHIIPKGALTVYSPRYTRRAV